MVMLVIFCGSADAQSHLETIVQSPSSPAKPLVVYAVLDHFAKKVGFEFERLYGTKVRVVPMRGSGATLTRLKYEKKRPKADVWFGGSMGAHAQGAFEGLVSAYKPAGASQLNRKFSNPLGDQRVTGLYAGILCLVGNTHLLEQKGIRIPQSWQDLTDPVYKGLIGLKKPTISGTAYTMLATVMQIMGEEQGLSYLKALNSNVSSYSKMIRSYMDKDKIAIIVGFVHEEIPSNTPPVNQRRRVVIPSEGTGYEIGGLSLVYNAPQSVLAKKFIDLAVSMKMQAREAKTSNRIPTHTRVTRHPYYGDLSQFKLIDYDFAWAGKNRQRLVKLWQQQVIR